LPELVWGFLCQDKFAIGSLSSFESGFVPADKIRMRPGLGIQITVI
jgi:hypothetical protein